MWGREPEDCFYYLTLYNENYEMPAMPAGDGVTEGIVKGVYPFASAPEGPSRRATILFSGSAYGAAAEAQELLSADWDVAASLWSATSYKGLREDALTVERWNRLHPTQPARMPYVTSALADAGAEGPIVAVTDFMKAVPDQVARWVPRPFVPLGTDGFGRSDTRANLRRHFETDAAHIVVAVLSGLVSTGDAKEAEVTDAIGRYGIAADAPDPREA
jgi:pyruvate dehydrogenase E1 component